MSVKIRKKNHVMRTRSNKTPSKYKTGEYSLVRLVRKSAPGPGRGFRLGLSVLNRIYNFI